MHGATLMTGRKPIPRGTRRVGGEVLTGKTRAREAETREHRRAAMYALMDAHPETAEEWLATRINESRKSTPLVRAPVLRAIRKAERMTGDGSQVSGTGLTILKRTDAPLARLANLGTIGAEELRAADDIMLAYEAIAGGLRMRAIDLSQDRVDGGRGGNASDAMLDAERRYRAWADHWSKRAKRGDPTLEIVWAVVVDERPIRVIEQDLGIRNGRASAAIVTGLRDYVIRANWSDQKLERQWENEKVPTFELRRVG